jgi:putative phage-type endonuclease
MPTVIDPLDLPQAEYEAWLVGARKSVGGSDMGALIGVDAFTTPADLWDRILNRVPRSASSPDTERGHLLEAHVANTYGVATGRTAERVGTLFTVAGRPWLRASVDRLLTAPDRDGRGVLEIKVPRARTFYQYRIHGVAAAYYAQLQHYMGAHDLRWGAFAIFNADAWELFHFDVERDDAYVAMLWTKAEAFWTEHVLGRRRPEPTLEPLVAEIRTPRVGGEATACDSAEWIAAVRALRVCKEAQIAADHAYAMQCERVQALMNALGQEIDIVAGGGCVVRWNLVRAQRFDVTAFRRDHPALAAEYARTITTRPFRPSWGE